MIKKPRTINVVDFFYDGDGNFEDKSTKRLFPNGKYQTWVYVNFKEADPASTMFMAISLSTQLEGEDPLVAVPMLYVGTVERDGETYKRWEYPMPNIVQTQFKRDREISLNFEFHEESSVSFIGIYDDFTGGNNSLQMVDDFEEGSYAYVLGLLDEQEEGTYLYEDVGGTLTWVKTNEFYILNQTFGSDIATLFVARALRINKEAMDESVTDTILKYIAQLKSQIGGIPNLYTLDGVGFDNVIDAINATMDKLGRDGSEPYKVTIDGVEYTNITSAVEAIIAKANYLAENKLDKTGDTMSGTLDMNGQSIVNLPDPTAQQDPVTKEYGENNYIHKDIINDEFIVPTVLNMQYNRIKNLADPDALTDAVNKQVLDAGLATKSNVGHTHTESEITDLDKYSQSEANALLDTKLNASVYIAFIENFDLDGDM